jgi:hypothetical protein
MTKYQRTAKRLPQLLEKGWNNHEARLEFAYAAVKCLSQRNIKIPKEELFYAIIRQEPIQKGESDYQQKIAEAFISSITLLRDEQCGSLEALKYQLKQISQLKNEMPQKIARNTKNATLKMAQNKVNKR